MPGDGPTPGRRVIDPDGLHDSEEFNYSQGIVENGTFYASGQVALDTSWEIQGDDIESQTRRAFENVGMLLDEVDRDYSDVTKVTSYVINPHEHLEGIVSVWDELFDAPYPCHTLIGVDQLALEGLLVEIEVEVPIEE